MRTALFAITALVGAAAAIATGLGNNQPYVGVAGAVGVFALCWTFATWGRR
jgi:hypothetical protein